MALDLGTEATFYLNLTEAPTDTSGSRTRRLGTNRSPLGTVLNYLDPIHTFPPNFQNIDSLVILSPSRSY